MADELVLLHCVQEGSKVRMKIQSPGYIPGANCQISRSIRTVSVEESFRKAIKVHFLFILLLNRWDAIILFRLLMYDSQALQTNTFTVCRTVVLLSMTRVLHICAPVPDQCLAKE